MSEEKEEAKEEQRNETVNKEEVPSKFMSFRDFFLNTRKKWIDTLVVKEYESNRQN